MAVSRKNHAAKSFVSCFLKPGGADACQFLSCLWNLFSSKRISLSFKSKTLRNLVSPHFFGGSSHNKQVNVLTGSTQICKTTQAVKHNENSCSRGEKDREDSSGTFLCCLMVSSLKFGILWALHEQRLPHAPDCPHEVSVLELWESIFTPASCRRMGRCGWVGQEREEGGGSTHLTKAYFCFIIGCWLNDLLGHLLTVIAGN